MLPPADPESKDVAIFEAAIDSMSHQTMCLYGYIPQFDGWRISLSGTSTLGLMYFLETHLNVNHCVVCTDKDDAGERIAARITEIQGITSERSLPIYGNDWNEALQSALKISRAKNQLTNYSHDERS